VQTAEHSAPLSCSLASSIPLFQDTLLVVHIRSYPGTGGTFYMNFEKVYFLSLISDVRKIIILLTMTQLFFAPTHTARKYDVYSYELATFMFLVFYHFPFPLKEHLLRHRRIRQTFTLFNLSQKLPQRIS